MSLTAAACPECGLTFSDGKRTFRTFGHPVVTLDQHLAYHAEETARAAELEEARQAQNALPLVEGHQTTDALCEERCRRAEQQSDIRLPVVVPSRMTMRRENEEAILWEELPRVTPSRLARHIKVYGREGTDWLETVEVPKLPRVRRAKKSRTTKRPSKAARRQSQGIPQ